MKRPRWSPCTSGTTTNTPLMTSDSVTVAMVASLDVDAAVVADHHAQRARTDLRAHDFDLATDERVLDSRDVDDAAPFEDNRMLDLRVHDLAEAIDRCERPDEAVDDARAGGNGHRAADVRALDLGPLLDDDAALDLRGLVDRAVETGGDLLEQEAVGLENRRELARVDPPTQQYL